MPGPETLLGAAIWTLLGNTAARDQDISLQWVPARPVQRDLGRSNAETLPWRRQGGGGGYTPTAGQRLSRSRQYPYHIGRLPYLTSHPDGCHACEGKECPWALSAVCSKKTDTPEHVLLRYGLCLAGAQPDAATRRRCRGGLGLRLLAPPEAND